MAIQINTGSDGKASNTELLVNYVFSTLLGYYFGGLYTVWKETHACSLNDIHVIWRSF